MAASAFGAPEIEKASQVARLGRSAAVVGGGAGEAEGVSFPPDARAAIPISAAISTTTTIAWTRHLRSTCAERVARDGPELVVAHR